MQSVSPVSCPIQAATFILVSLQKLRILCLYRVHCKQNSGRHSQAFWNWNGLLFWHADGLSRHACPLWCLKNCLSISAVVQLLELLFSSRLAPRLSLKIHIFIQSRDVVHLVRIMMSDSSVGDYYIVRSMRFQHCYQRNGVRFLEAYATSWFEHHVIVNGRASRPALTCTCPTQMGESGSSSSYKHLRLRWA